MPDQSDPIKKDDAPAKPLTAAQKLKAKRKRAKELRMMHKLGIPTPKKGGKRAGAGQRPFSPTDDQRRIVLMMKGMKQSEEVIANAIMNPHTQWPITVETLHKHFRKELDTGVAAVIAILSGTLMKNLARGLEGTSFFMSKNLMGFRSGCWARAMSTCPMLMARRAAPRSQGASLSRAGCRRGRRMRSLRATTMTKSRQRNRVNSAGLAHCHKFCHKSGHGKSLSQMRR